MKRLVIVYPKAIGDFIFALPTLHTVRRALPNTHITLVVKAKQAPLALPQKGVLIDDILVIGGDMDWFGVRRRVTRLKPDIIFDMAGNDQSGLILTCRSSKRLRPHRADCKGFASLYSLCAESMPQLQPGMHRVEELLCFARALGADNPVYSFKLELPNRAIEESERMIEKYQLRSGTVIALNVGASRDSKRWPPEHFEALAEALVDGGFRVVLTGARGFKYDSNYDYLISKKFATKNFVDGEHCTDLISNANLPPDLQLQRDAHFLRYSGVPKVVVGNDTGPMQIAGSIGDDAKNKTVSLFGPTNWGRYAPYDASRSFPDKPTGTWNRVLSSGIACAPSGSREACARYRSGCNHKS
ncbi:MAG: glycosyltransferase family 9 protein, partial [Lentisphaerae bacterium]|nr:glycosyltransferase family 9 protein [Lentisphaerota bacterium]